ncbi:hypothetical protein CEXT_232871 [Caerostris extrusa]|uniref:Uncharacterized protein n=1 Tax=Caerostris extrusa TaxID=172846 RepID=A0AAV4XEF2_CAEEX|nr:hypothetical protein CEXT_232871 [Caerostris extrusa]
MILKTCSMSGVVRRHPLQGREITPQGTRRSLCSISIEHYRRHAFVNKIGRQTFLFLFITGFHLIKAIVSLVPLRSLKNSVKWHFEECSQLYVLDFGKSTYFDIFKSTKSTSIGDPGECRGMFPMILTNTTLRRMKMVLPNKNGSRFMQQLTKMHTDEF